MRSRVQAPEGAGAAPTVRLFAGVWPPDEVVRLLSSLPRPEARGVRWTPPEQWHVTLSFLGDVAESAVDALGSALADAVAGAGGPVEARLGPATLRLGRAVLCVPVEGLDALATAARAGIATVLPGSEPDPLGFRGHLTLARAHRRRSVPASLVGVPVAARWRVDTVSLVRSELGTRGARYTTLVRATVPS